MMLFNLLRDSKPESIRNLPGYRVNHYTNWPSNIIFTNLGVFYLKKSVYLPFHMTYQRLKSLHVFWKLNKKTVKYVIFTFNAC